MDHVDGGEARCSFCKKAASATAHLVTGPGVGICDVCVELAMEILIEADAFPRSRVVPLLLKKRGTNKAQTTTASPRTAETPSFQFASDFDGDLHLFPGKLDQADHQQRYQVWVITTAGERAKATAAAPVMCVEGNTVTNPHGTSGHRSVAGWDVDHPHAEAIEVVIEDGPTVRLPHPRRQR